MPIHKVDQCIPGSVSQCTPKPYFLLELNWSSMNNDRFISQCCYTINVKNIQSVVTERSILKKQF